MAIGAVPAAPFEPSPAFVAWLDELAKQPPVRRKPCPVPEEPDDD